MSADQRSCPDCGNPYPFDDDDAPPAQPTIPGRPQRSDLSGGSAAGVGGGGAAASAQPPGRQRVGARSGGFLDAIAPYRTTLVLAAVLILIVVVAYVLFSIVMAYFGERRPDPSSLPTPIAGPVLVPNGSPVPGASPSPGTGTVISPAASPSPSAPAARMKIANTDGQGANMRQRPSTTAPVLRTLAEGTVVDAIGGDTNAEGRNWRNIRDVNGQTGWVASELIVPE